LTGDVAEDCLLFVDAVLDLADLALQLAQGPGRDLAGSSQSASSWQR
jgi:hypothetical protein